MTLGLIQDVVALGVGAEVAGAVFQPIENLADTIILELVQFALEKLQVILQINLKLEAVLNASIHVDSKGRNYRLTIKTKTEVNNHWIHKTFEIGIFYPWVGFPELLSYLEVVAN